MKVNIFLPKYMIDFKCINSGCSDTCCAGWDINIDEDTYNRYINSTGHLKELVEEKYIKNVNNHDYFNHGFMVLKNENKCPFLNCSMLCDIHGETGEENLCITCKNYPRVFNIVDDIYEKSGLPSCPEICAKAFLNKDKMEFIESEEEIDERNIEIRRIIDTEAFEGTESLLQYFWDIRVISINIMQLRSFSIEERLNILKYFYKQIEKLWDSGKLDEIEEFLLKFNNEYVEYSDYTGEAIKEDNEFYLSLADDNLEQNVRGVRLKECIKEYKNGVLVKNNIAEYIEETSECYNGLESNSHVLENYLVNQIFKDLIPFNKGGSITKSIEVLINSYRIIKAYVIGIAIYSKEEVNEKLIVRVIQALSKDIEHNKVFKDVLER